MKRYCLFVPICERKKKILNPTWNVCVFSTGVGGFSTWFTIMRYLIFENILYFCIFELFQKYLKIDF